MYQQNRFCVTHAFASHAATPAGGAAKAGRGCLLALFAFVSPVAALDLPSGTQAALQEVLVDQVGQAQYVRFRFVAPTIDRTLDHAPDYAALEGDFPHLCSEVALPYLSEYQLSADKIVISVADRMMDFGTTDPDATQYFEQFRAENGLCIWEGF